VDDIHAREHISLTAAEQLARLARLRFDSPAVMASQLGPSSLSLVYSSVLLAANSFNPFIYLSGSASHGQKASCRSIGRVPLASVIKKTALSVRPWELNPPPLPEPAVDSVQSQRARLTLWALVASFSET
jgi:hypothetical protein